ncbi:MAG: hypothetical protein OXH02_02240 [Gemmatimonadetes bacterium]|nr:hypothetical protein [Gemmatimonadota bacterium]
MKTLPEQVTQMCEDGKLEYYMEDGRYFVSRESIDVFMHPPIGQPATANPDTNGTPRRQYGRAPHDIEPSPEPASESRAVNGTDEVVADDGLKSDDGMDETPGRGMEETPGHGDEVAETAETDDLVEAEVEETAEDAQLAEVREAEGAQPVDDLAVEVVPPVDDLAVTNHVETDDEPLEVAEEVRPKEGLEEAEEEHLEEAAEDFGELEETVEDPGELEETPEDPGKPDARVAEILADLRAALSRHAREHKAFCDEIAALADALESTLSRDGDKTSELTREISSLLARYTRR